MNTRFRLWHMGLWFLSACWLAGTAIDICTAQELTEAGRSFDRDIAPVLVRRCLDCHNAAEKKGMLDLSRVESMTKGGESGAAIISGKSAESLLWQRVRDGEMPPKKPLPKEEVELLRRWIDGGAKWGTSPIDPFAVTTNARAGYDWWSLQPVRRLALPEIRNSKSD